MACTKDYCTEAMVKEQTVAVATKLKPLGWKYITLGMPERHAGAAIGKN